MQTTAGRPASPASSGTDGTLGARDHFCSECTKGRA